MIFSYDDMILRFGSAYQVQHAIKRKEVYKIEAGIYSDKQTISPFALVNYKYPEGVITLDTAFYIHGLTDVVPDKIYLATRRNATRIRNPEIVQVFSDERFLELGKITMPFEGETIQIYNLERSLIELMRNSKSMPLDYYKELILAFRVRIHQMDIGMIEQFLNKFDRKNYMISILQREVL